MNTSAEVRGPAADARSAHVAPAGAGRPIWMTVVFACTAMLVSYLPFSAVNGVLGTIGATTGATASAGSPGGWPSPGPAAVLVVATSTAVAVQSAPAELAGMAGAANNAVRQLGGALGTAVVGVVFAARLHAGAGYAAAVHACAITLVVLLVAAAATAAALLFARHPSTAA